MMDTKGELLPLLEQIEKEKNIKKEEILKVIETSLISAYRKYTGKDINVEAKINSETGEIQAYTIKKVVPQVTNPNLEISIEDAKKNNQEATLDSEIKTQLDTQEFSRIAAQTAKQVILQKIHEQERINLFDEFKLKEGQVVSASVYRFIDKSIIVDLGKTEGILPVREQVRNEHFRVSEYLRVLIVSVERGERAPRILLSRNRPELIRKLFEMEVPEIYEKIVEIVQIAREPGVRSKVVVTSHNIKVDPVGACVGMRGSRVKPIIDELRNERIDLILYSKDIQTFIQLAFSPAKVLSVNIIDPSPSSSFSEGQKRAEVVVSDNMLSLAIGKGGTNVNLVCRLTGYHIDVRSESQKKAQAQEKVTFTVEELSELKGIGKKLAEILFKAGYTNIEKIAKAQISDLTTLQGVGEKTSEKIIKSAKKKIQQNGKD